MDMLEQQPSFFVLQYHALNHLSGTSKTVVWTQNFWTINSNSGPFGVCLLSFLLHTVPKLPHEALKEAGFHGNFSPSRGVKFLNGWFQGRQNFGKIWMFRKWVAQKSWQQSYFDQDVNMMSIFSFSWNPKQPLTHSWRAATIPHKGVFLCWHFNEKYWDQKETKQKTVWTIKIEISSLNHQTDRTPSLPLSRHSATARAKLLTYLITHGFVGSNQSFNNGWSWPVGSRMHAIRPSSVMTVPSFGSRMINLTLSFPVWFVSIHVFLTF